jgi:transcriptional regulator with XRE-family HTH domain
MKTEKQITHINSPTEAMYRGIFAGSEFALAKIERKNAIKTRLKEFRKSTGLTQAQFSDKVKVNRITYAGYEVGQAEPAIEVLCRIADCFDISLDYLCYRTNNPKGIPQHNKEQIQEIEEQIQALHRKLNEIK